MGAIKYREGNEGSENNNSDTSIARAMRAVRILIVTPVLRGKCVIRVARVRLIRVNAMSDVGSGGMMGKTNDCECNE